MKLQIDNPNFIAGYTSATAGLPREANPFLMDAAPRKGWYCGHAWGLIVKNETELNAEPLERTDKSAFVQGQIAYSSGIRLDDNPYGNGDMHGTPEEIETAQCHYDWRHGWLRNASRVEVVVSGDGKAAYADTPPHAAPGDTEALYMQRFGRAYRDVSPRMVPLVDQRGRQVGQGRLILTHIDCHMDDNGTVWTPPTAWAYMAACRALHATQAREDALNTELVELRALRDRLQDDGK